MDKRNSINMSNGMRILIAPLFGMGDTLMTTPALEILKKQYPQCHITNFTFSKINYDVLQHNPHIDELIYYPLTKQVIKGTLYLLKNVSFKYDHCLLFYPSNKLDYNLFSFLSFAPKRIGHRYLFSNFSQLNWLKNQTLQETKNGHCAEENVKLLQFLGINHPLDQIPPMSLYLTEKDKEIGFAEREKLPHDKKIVGIHAGTSVFKGHLNRRWPVSHFIRLINLLPDYHFALFGTGDEVTVNHQIREAVENSNAVSVIEGLSIRETAATIKNLDYFISNDSGLMHLAAAVGTAVLALIGPTNKNFIYPWGVTHRCSTIEVGCSPCFFYSPKPLRCHMDNSFQCLNAMTPEYVFNEFMELVNLDSAQ